LKNGAAENRENFAGWRIIFAANRGCGSRRCFAASAK